VGFSLVDRRYSLTAPDVLGLRNNVEVFRVYAQAVAA
jgi:hypothetical protein